jgi:hypothetical protein
MRRIATRRASELNKDSFKQPRCLRSPAFLHNPRLQRLLVEAQINKEIRNISAVERP